MASLCVKTFSACKTAVLFVNSTFGWPVSFAIDLPSGGPAIDHIAVGRNGGKSRRSPAELRLSHGFVYGRDAGLWRM